MAFLRSFCLFVGLTLGAAAPALATTYYISPSGSDTHSGTSPDLAWKTVQAVNARDFDPGDAILFQGGHTFSGNLYFDTADRGTPDAPITVSSYGSGRATIYAGNGRGVLAYNTAGFRISELFIVGSGRDVNTESGILFFTDLAGDVLLDTVIIDHVDAVRFGDYGVEIGSANGRSGYRNVSITHTVAGENGLGGIFTYAQQRAVHRNVYVGYSSAFLNAGFYGLLYNSGNGITLAGVDGGMVERCVARDNGWRSDASNGPIGIWAYDSNNVVIQFNESYHNKTGGTKDGGGFSLDNSTSNSILQYNYSHDNAGAGYLLAHKWDDNVHTGNIIRYNVSQNDARQNRYAAIHTWGRIRHAQIYNNTVYMTYPGGAARVVYLRNTSIESQDPQYLHIRNNIFQVTGGVPLVDAASSVLDGAIDVRFEGNVYYTTGSSFRIYWRGSTYSSLSAWRATGQERLDGRDVGASVDPQLMKPGGGPSFNNAEMIGGLWQYRLKSTSPLIDTGLNLPVRFATSIGPRDFFGGASYRHFGYDVGAHEFYVSCNWTLDTSDATVPASGGTGPVSVWAAADDCGWAALPSASWLGATPEAGSGTGTLSYWVLPNSGSARTGKIDIGGRTFTVAQGGSAASLPSGWTGGDVGAVGVPGSSSVSGGTHTLSGSGSDVWGTADEFHFAARQVDGDFEIVTRVASVENVDPWTKAGIMIRETWEGGSKHASMMVTPGKGVAVQYRSSTGGTTANIPGGSGTAPQWVRLVRAGSTITAYRSSTGSSWTRVGEVTISMGSSVLAGLFVSSHDDTRLATATFDSVAITGASAPPPASGGSGEDIVLYAAEATVEEGWSVVNDSTAAAGTRLQNPNAGAPKIGTPLASLGQYFELTFNALAGRPYRLWIRGKATSNSYANDSVHVQFDNTVDAAGAAIWRIGSTTGTEVNIEDCSGCGLSGWGWQDNGWGVNVKGPTFYFASDGTQRIRVQVREDGLGIDQIVISSVRWLETSPGALKNDATILPKQ